jgi:hypothetical protein
MACHVSRQLGGELAKPLSPVNQHPKRDFGEEF